MKEKRVFALGFFDGVHLGHQALLSAARELSRQLGCQTAAVTFEGHPQSLFAGDVPPLLTTLDDRVRLLTAYGVEYVHVLSVTRTVMSTPWETFLEELVDLGAAGFVCGYDFRFGNRGEGTAEKLEAYCRQRDLACIIVPEQILEGVRISSSHIRVLIAAGRLEQANRFLGHRHILTGQVVSGRKLGRRLGFPTANVLLPEGVAELRSGVYACRVSIGGLSRMAVTNVGSRPTVSGHQKRTETWVLDYEGDLYGATLTLEFCAFLRPEETFPSLEELQKAIRRDAEETRRFFAGQPEKT